MTIVEEKTAITVGVDTLSEIHVAAALDPLGDLLQKERPIPVVSAPSSNHQTR